MKPDFDELVGSDLDDEERSRLLRAHELLIAAGPLPELPPALAKPGPPQAGQAQAEIITPIFTRRRNATIAVLAAALAAAAFGIGYLTGNHGGGGGFPEKNTVVMHGTAGAPVGALATIALGNRDAAGNWQMLVRVSHLKKLPPGSYYTLWLTRKGKPTAPCGSFLVHAKTTELRFTVAYKRKGFDGWVVTQQTRGHREPGPVVLKTV